MAEEMMKFTDGDVQVVTDDDTVIENAESSGLDVVPYDEDDEDDEDEVYSVGLGGAVKTAGVMVTGAVVGYGAYKGIKWLTKKIKERRIKSAQSLLQKEGYIIEVVTDDEDEVNIEDLDKDVKEEKSDSTKK